MASPLRELSAAPSQSPTFASPLQELLSTQSAEGWFAQPKQAATPPADLVDRLPKTDRERVGWTIAVLTQLRRDFGSDEPIWRAAYEKAVRYLAKVTGLNAKEVKELLEAVPVK